MIWQKMMFENLPFSFSRNAVNYSWRQLARRAGIEGFNLGRSEPNFHGIPLYYGHPEKISQEGRKIIVIPCRDENWQALLGNRAGKLDWFAPREAFPATARLPIEYSIPVIFWGDMNKGGKVVEYHNNGTLIFRVDILATIFFMLSRWEEMRPSLYDLHGRFPASASLAGRQGFLDIPVVDVYGLLVREWFKVLMPGWQPMPSPFKVNITHDIDWISRFSGIGQFLRMAGSALIKRRSPGEFFRQFKDLFVQLTMPEQDEFYRSIFDLADMSEAHGYSSRFYFMAADTNKYQQGYDPALPLVRKCLLELNRRGHEIGIHPGYDTLDRPEQLVGEKQRLEKAAGRIVFGGRQHYLRFHVPDTWRHWEKAGLDYDSTLGYADHEGFRCGTCHAYYPFDIGLDRELQVREIPLIAMDTTLFQHRKLSSSEGKKKIIDLARRCADVGGTFTLLWHNTSLTGDRENWGPVYQEVLSELSNLKIALHDQQGELYDGGLNH